MKVAIDDSFEFNSSFEDKLKQFLKEEFVKQVGMEVPKLWVPFQDIEVDENTGISIIKKFRLSWYTGGSIGLQHLSWKSKSKKNFTGSEQIDQDDLEFSIGSFFYHLDMLRDSIPKMFRKQFWLGYRFIVEVNGLGMDAMITVETDKDNFGNVIHLIEESFNEWNESGDGLIHSFSPIQSKNKLKIRIDTGSAGEPGIKHLVQSLNDSQLDITKIILSDANA